MSNKTWSYILARYPCRRVSARLNALAMTVTGVMLVACSSPQGPLIPPSLRVHSDVANEAATKAEAKRPEIRFTDLPMAPESQPSSITASNSAADKETQTGTASNELASVNLEQVSIGVFAQLVYADILKKNVSIDPQIQARKDLVTFRSGSSQTAAQLDNAAKLLLKSYGVAAIDLGGLVRVVPDNASLGNLPEIRRGAALPDTPMPLRPIFQLVELKAVRNAEIAGWLRTMFGDRIKTQEDISRNAILISGTPDNMSAAMEAIRVLDQPVLSGVQSTAITPAFWSADELARRLFDVLSAQGYAVQPLNQAAGGVRYPIILLPVTGLNSVFVFARGADVLKHVTDWARTLDKPNERGIGKNFFTYAVQHKDAATLAITLEQLLLGVRTGAAPPATAATTPTRQGSVVVDKATNMLIFQASQEEYPQITALLQTLDRPAKGALIEVTVAELSLDDKSQLGVEWLANQALSNGAKIVGGTSGALSLGSAGLNVRVLDSVGGVRLALNALASDNKATILSSPRVLARNGETATIQVGEEVPIVTSQQSTGSTSIGNTLQGQVLQTIQYRTTGVILKVKPVIHSGDQVDLDVTQEVSAARSTSTGVNTSPTFSTRKIDTKLTLRNGATVLLGGLISEQSSQGSAGIPLLKDVPLLGQLFNTNTKSGARSELIVLITPYIISDDREAETVTAAFRKMLGPWAGTVGEAETKKPLAAPMVVPAASGVQRKLMPPAPAASTPVTR